MFPILIVFIKSVLQSCFFWSLFGWFTDDVQSDSMKINCGITAWSNVNLECDGFPKTSFLRMGILKSCIPQWEKAVIYTNNSTRRNNLAVLNDITD